MNICEICRLDVCAQTCSTLHLYEILGHDAIEDSLHYMTVKFIILIAYTTLMETWGVLKVDFNCIT